MGVEKERGAERNIRQDKVVAESAESKVARAVQFYTFEHPFTFEHRKDRLDGGCPDDEVVPQSRGCVPASIGEQQVMEVLEMLSRTSDTADPELRRRMYNEKASGLDGDQCHTREEKLIAWKDDLYVFKCMTCGGTRSVWDDEGTMCPDNYEQDFKSNLEKRTIE